MTMFAALLKTRADAGKRYRDAIEELRYAALELAALDYAARVMNQPVPSFPCAPQVLPVSLRHEEFAAAEAWPSGFAGDVKTCANALLAKLGFLDEAGNA
jgi:hypothetical protein